jgi:hypothetical protein
MTWQSNWPDLTPTPLLFRLLCRGHDWLPLCRKLLGGDEPQWLPPYMWTENEQDVIRAESRSIRSASLKRRSQESDNII